MPEITGHALCLGVAAQPLARRAEGRAAVGLVRFLAILRRRSQACEALSNKGINRSAASQFLIIP